jgi:hypothetical protein
MTAGAGDRPTGRWPPHGWLGLVLIAVFWPLNWSLEGMRTHWGFFPLWLGYCLAVDALVLRRTGTSLLRRGRLAYAGLFLLSAPVWWLFEAINLRTQNWFYAGRESFTDLEYFLLASWSFSTVIPAVFGTAELAASFRWVRRLPAARPLHLHPGAVLGCGIAAFAALMLWPRYAFPLVWLSLWWILEPMNLRLGNPSLLDDLRGGDWRRLVALGLGAVICGLFWEMWNFWSFPKWHYRIPFVGFGHVFEMPILGYGGYVPFGWELFAVYSLAASRLFPRDYLRV